MLKTIICGPNDNIAFIYGGIALLGCQITIHLLVVATTNKANNLFVILLMTIAYVGTEHLTVRTI